MPAPRIAAQGDSVTCRGPRGASCGWIASGMHTVRRIPRVDLEVTECRMWLVSCCPATRFDLGWVKHETGSQTRLQREERKGDGFRVRHIEEHFCPVLQFPNPARLSRLSVLSAQASFAQRAPAPYG